MARSRLRRIAVVAAALAVVVAAGLTVLLLVVGAIEYRYHAGSDDTFGYVNVEGYRGPRLSRKRPGEFRVVVAGGSTVYGQGIESTATIPAALERRLRGQGHDVSVANLGYMNEGA